MAIATEIKTKVQQWDVKTAYLNSDLSEELYMELPEGFAEAINKIIYTERRDSKLYKTAMRKQKALKNDNQVCRLRKALYGLKQSGERWYSCLRDILSKIGLKPTASDPCIFIGEIQGFTISITVWVGNILVVANNEELLKHVKNN